jgi:23S rRNA (uracil1939-C5)-methyltransferase
MIRLTELRRIITGCCAAIYFFNGGNDSCAIAFDLSEPGHFLIFAAKYIKVGRKKRLPLLENIEIESFAAEGKSLARVENMVLFVPGLVPGDIADIQVRRKRKNFMEGFVVELKKPSPLRIKAKCSHFGTCGGCKWQHLSYAKQLEFKQQQVADNLQRIGRVELPEIKPIIGSDKQFCYRNKLEYTFSQIRWLSDDEIQHEEEITDRCGLGFHIPGKFDRILNIDTCYLQDDLSNEIRNAVRKYTLAGDYSYYHQRNNDGLMRNLIIRNSTLAEWMVILVFGSNDRNRIDPLMEHVKNNFPGLTSLMYVINTKVNDTIHDQDVLLYSGRDHIFEELSGLRFKIGPKSFFQTNSAQAEKLYAIIKSMAGLSGSEVVYDLYTGTGTIAACIAGSCRKVIGIEYVGEAIADADVNSGLNGIGNTVFLAGDIKDVLNNDFLERHGRPEVIITDPPRAGMHADVVKMIGRAGPEKIIYVSCNPATQARDVQLLADLYTIDWVQPVDMFPHTHHVENVIRLVKK